MRAAPGGLAGRAQTCDHNLQAEAGEGRTPRDEGDWRPCDNMIFSHLGENGLMAEASGV